MSKQKVGKNKVVSLTYMIFNDQGEVQEQSDIPVSYLHGDANSDLFPKVAEALEGAGPGDVIEVTLSPEEGFGIYDPSKTYSDVIDNVPPEFREIGAEAEFQNEIGESITMTVTEIKDGRITLDGNHPFAGKTMKFRITTKDVRDASESEATTGVVVQNHPLMH
jgi:FKBP-type peptidyl-prolyl cis-trans isomerase SlyD